MKPKCSTIKVISILFCAANFACSQTGIEQEDTIVSKTPPTDRQTQTI